MKLRVMALRQCGYVALAALFFSSCAGPASELGGQTLTELEAVLAAPSEEVAEAAALEAELLREAFIVDCMKADGFEYIARDVGTAVVDLLPVEELGFGTSTILEPAYWLPLQLEDPNDSIKAALDPSATTVYDSVIDICYQRAVSQIVPAASNLIVTTSGTDRILAEATERTRADERVLDASRAWRTCVGSYGYDFESQEAMHNLFGQQTQQFASAMDDAVNTLLAEGVPVNEIRELTFAEILPEPSLQVLRDLQAYEVQVEGDVSKCNDEYSEIERDVYIEILKAYVE